MQRLLLGPGSIAMSTAVGPANESQLPLQEALLLVVVYAAASRVPARHLMSARCLLLKGAGGGTGGAADGAVGVAETAGGCARQWRVPL